MPAQTQPNMLYLSSDDWEDYALLDSGNEGKLERFGPYVTARPEAKAFWSRSLDPAEWSRADAVFIEGTGQGGSHWKFRTRLEPRWAMRYRQLKFWVEPTPFRHMGVFPEQAASWDWLHALIKNAGRPVNVLNLYGYTGLATLAAATAGASVTHIDASRKSITWGRDNQNLSGLDTRPIRWIPEDAMKFVRREIKRGTRYDAIIMDPPKFGRGPQGEIWKLDDSLNSLLDECRKLLTPQPLFVILTVYAASVSPLSIYYLIKDMMHKHAGTTTAGELVLKEKSAGRLLPSAIFARWQS